MDKVPVKYRTICTSRESDRVVEEAVYEAINEEEATARAYLNCVLHNDHDKNVAVSVKRI